MARLARLGRRDATQCNGQRRQTTGNVVVTSWQCWRPGRRDASQCNGHRRRNEMSSLPHKNTGHINRRDASHVVVTSWQCWRLGWRDASQCKRQRRQEMSLLPHGNAGVQAGEMHHRIGHARSPVLTWLHNDGEPLRRELDLLPIVEHKNEALS
jgi:hypothetical protein